MVGEYGATSVILYIPNINKGLLDIGKKIYKVLTTNNFKPIVGIAYYPCLSFVKRDILSNARQAFEHASLLKEDRVVVFNSITLSLKGDKLFREGSYLMAIEEYKLALMLDKENVLARNSLAICYTILGEYGKAKKEFERCLDYEPDNSIVLYNIGCLNMKIGELGIAEKFFKKCLILDKSNIFSLLRLAQIAQLQGMTKRAKSLYKAALKKDNNVDIVYRLLAELLLKEGNIEEAKQYLHKGVSINPYDHRSFYLLARIYIEREKDLDIGISFLKRSISLNPQEESYKETLQKVLEKTGNTGIEPASFNYP